MSDLFCAATLVVVRGGTSSVSSASAGLDDLLQGLRVAAVWSSELGQDTAAAVVRRTGTALTLRTDLDDPDCLPGTLEELADAFRGETVVVVGDQPLVDAIRVAAVNGASLPPLELGQSATAEVDADGLVVRRWGGRTLDA